MLAFLAKFGEDVSALKNLGITQLDVPNLYISAEEVVIHMNQATDALTKTYNKRVSLKASSFYIRATALVGELLARHPEQEKEKSPAFAIFLGTKVHETKIISQ